MYYSKVAIAAGRVSTCADFGLAPPGCQTLGFVLMWGFVPLTLILFLLDTCALPGCNYFTWGTFPKKKTHRV